METGKCGYFTQRLMNLIVMLWEQRLLISWDDCNRIKRFMLKMTLNFDSSMGGLGFMNLGFFWLGWNLNIKKPPLGTGFSISNKLNFFEKNTKCCFSIKFTTFGIFGKRKILKRQFPEENGRKLIDFWK